MNRAHIRYFKGFLVVRRINYFTDRRYYSSKERAPSIFGGHDEVLKYYRGIEGEPWPLNTDLINNFLIEGLLPLNQYKVAAKYYEEVNKKYLCDLIYLQTYTKSNSQEVLPDNFSFGGYDYGIYISEYNYYSVIFHEVIYGKYDELRDYSKYLNNNFLFSSIDIVKRLENTRNQLLKLGADLETVDVNEIFVPISIHLYPSLRKGEGVGVKP